MFAEQWIASDKTLIKYCCQGKGRRASTVFDTIFALIAWPKHIRIKHIYTQLLQQRRCYLR